MGLLMHYFRMVTRLFMGVFHTYRSSENAPDCLTQLQPNSKKMRAYASLVRSRKRKPSAICAIGIPAGLLVLISQNWTAPCQEQP